MSTATATLPGPAWAWHDVECGAYAADLATWERIAARREGPVLELGCGTGRVALHLARRGHDVAAIDTDATLVAELRARARAERLAVRAVAADAAELRLGERFAAILAPMQLLQVLGGEARRRAALRAAARHLAPGGRVAVALCERRHLPEPLQAPGSEGEVTAEGPGATPDVREIDGWVYSSQPVAIAVQGEAVEVRSRRQAVSPAGTLSEAPATTRLDLLDRERLDAEAADARLVPEEWIEIPDTAEHVGSAIWVLHPEGESR